MAVAVRQPQDQVRERQVGDDLPVGDEQVQPLDVVTVEVGVGAGDLVEGGHTWTLLEAAEKHGIHGESGPSGMARMAIMVVGFWQQVLDSDMAVPAGRPLNELTAELVTMLGSTNPVERDEIAYPVLATWISEGVYDDLLVSFGDSLCDRLAFGLGNHDDDTVFRRSFSALVLAECVRRDNVAHVLPVDAVLDWADRAIGWYVREQDLRGWVDGKGWAHAVAHGADLIGALGASRHLGAVHLGVLLDVLAERVTLLEHAHPHRRRGRPRRRCRPDDPAAQPGRPGPARHLGRAARPGDGPPARLQPGRVAVAQRPQHLGVPACALRPPGDRRPPDRHDCQFRRAPGVPGRPAARAARRHPTPDAVAVRAGRLTTRRPRWRLAGHSTPTRLDDAARVRT